MLDVFVMSKALRMFEFTEKRGITPNEHNGCRNLSSSAKSMEPARCEMLQYLQDPGNRVCSFSHLIKPKSHAFKSGNIFMNTTIKSQ